MTAAELICYVDPAKQERLERLTPAKRTAEPDPELLVYDVLTMQQIGLLCPHRF